VTKPQEQEPLTGREAFQKIKKVHGAILSIGWDVARGRVAVLTAASCLMAMSSAVQGFLSKFVIDNLTAGRGSRALFFGFLFLATIIMSALANGLFSLFQFDLADRITQEIDQRLMRRVSEIPGLDHLERPDFADKLRLVRDMSWVPLNFIFNLQSLVYLFFGLGATLVLLGFIHAMLLVPVLIVVPSSILQFRAHRKHQQRWDEIAPEDRLAYHYIELASDPRSAKEMRVFGLGPEIARRYRVLTLSYLRKLFKDRLKRSWVGLVSGLMHGAAVGGMIGFLGWLVLNDRASMGDFVMGVTISRMLMGHVEMASGMWTWLAEASATGERYLWMLEYESEVQLREDAYSAPETIINGITFQGVDFAYPGTDKQVLQDVSFFLPAGSTVAVVGENGAGKTTLVKLLSRFYDPDNGRILIDDLDLKDINLDEWRQKMSAAFQDFVKFQFIAKEAVGIGEMESIEDLERIGSSAKFAGADRVIEKLPEGFDSRLGRDFDGGTDLSEGEWQRVALARGAMRDVPALVVLDEPTASLDARAEHEVFASFASIARGRSSFKPITLLVSHRFSTVRMADLIIVMHEGNVEDIGSHEELMSREGRYAELFKLQASRYD
jgi:ATP-binding cassette subfamily B protein